MSKKKKIEEDVIIDDVQLSDEEQLMLDEENPVVIEEELIENIESVEIPDSDQDVFEIETSENFDLLLKFNTNKHRQEGKHSLERDTIFKGKLDKKEYDDNGDVVVDNTNHYEENPVVIEEELIENIESVEIPDSDQDVFEIETSENFDLLLKFNTNKHRQEGKHSLERDTIFKGKLDKKEYDDNGDVVVDNTNHYEQDDYSDSISFFDKYDDDEDYLDQNNLNKDVYEILKEHTTIDFTQNRRKPNKESFNEYYNLLLKELGFRYTKSEIFVELSYYFTDNIFNMFKLLDKRPATIIIKELTQKGYLKNLTGVKFL